MRISLEAFQRVQKSHNRRSLALIGLGVPGLIFSSFWVLLGLLMFFFGEWDGPWDQRSAATVIILFGFFPSSICGLMLWRGVRARQRMGRFEKLVAIAQESPGVQSSRAATVLRLSQVALTKALVEAGSQGFLRDLDEPGVWLESDARAAELQGPSAAQSFQPAPDGSFVGTVFGGNYRVGQLIGSGAMGDVYAASHVRTGRSYALKIVRRDLRLSPDAIKRFEREAMAANRIAHPNMVAVHDYDRADDGTHYLVMDLLEGETLQSCLARQGRLPWPSVQRIAVEVGGALEAAHVERLVHRDIKPGNIFLETRKDGSGRAVLLDFGLVKPMAEGDESRITATGAAVGTPMYMAPEQARGEAEDQRTDVYGLAAVVYEMVTGAPPFMDQTLASVYARLLTEQAEAPSSLAGDSCPPGLDEVLGRALAKKPGDRYPSMQEFTAALGGIQLSSAQNPGRRSA